MIDRIGELAMDSVTLDNIAKIIDYPQCWDADKYPTIEDAIRFMFFKTFIVLRKADN